MQLDSNHALNPLRQLEQFRNRLDKLTPRIWLTQLLIAANTFVFFLMWSNGVSLWEPTHTELIFWGANLSDYTAAGQPWRLFTCTFVHIGLLHIGFNMYVLWFLGRFYERLVGQTGYLILYVFSGIGGAMASLVWNSNAISAGASGAIFGILGGLGAFAARRPSGFPALALKSLRKSVITFLIYNLAIGFMLPMIDMAGHLGGLAAGFLGGLWLAQPIDKATRKSRNLANGALLLTSLVLLYGSYMATPRYDDWISPMREFSSLSVTLEQRVRMAEASQSEARTTRDEFLQVMNNDVLLPWRTLRDRFEALHRVPPRQTEHIARVHAYIVTHEAQWRNLTTNIEDPTAAAINQQHFEYQAEEARNALIEYLDMRDAQSNAEE